MSQKNTGLGSQQMYHGNFQGQLGFHYSSASSLAVFMRQRTPLCLTIGDVPLPSLGVPMPAAGVAELASSVVVFG